jgi:hypothetical protein
LHKQAEELMVNLEKYLVFARLMYG